MSYHKSSFGRGGGTSRIWLIFCCLPVYSTAPVRVQAVRLAMEGAQRLPDLLVLLDLGHFSPS